MADEPTLANGPPWDWHLVIQSGNFTLLLTSSGQEWQFHIATDIYWSRMANFTLLLTSSGQEWQLADVPLDLLADLSPQMHHGIYIMGCIWQPFWILQEKVGISFYFWIIRLVNSQLALYSHVRCNPLDTLQEHPQNTPKWQLQISTLWAHICQV